MRARPIAPIIFLRILAPERADPPMAGFAAVLRKDLTLELRGGESTLALVALSILILIVMVFALDPAGGAADAPIAAGALWVAMIFAGMAGAARTVLAERDNGCIRALYLSPLDRGALFLAKLAAASIFMIVAEAAVVLMLVLFFNLDFDLRLARMLPALALGLIGFAALATLLAAISGRVHAGDLLMPLLAVPMYVPALIAGVKASAAALGGAPWSAMGQWLRIMIAFDVLFVAAGFILFEHLLDED
jgi:heme exporter protein B